MRKFFAYRTLVCLTTMLLIWVSPLSVYAWQLGCSCAKSKNACSQVHSIPEMGCRSQKAIQPKANPSPSCCQPNAGPKTGKNHSGQTATVKAACCCQPSTEVDSDRNSSPRASADQSHQGQSICKNCACQMSELPKLPTDQLPVVPAPNQSEHDAFLVALPVAIWLDPAPVVQDHYSPNSSLSLVFDRNIAFAHFNC